MLDLDVAEWLKNERTYLMRVIKDFKPAHEDFQPTPDMLTVAQQIRHIAKTIDWFREGGFGDGFDLDFETEIAEMKLPCTLQEAMTHLDRAFDAMIAMLESLPAEKLAERLPPNPIMGELPRASVVFATSEHTSHHRGSLAVYLRLLGITPSIPYFDLPS